ncbi:MAG: hypothetical protein ACU84J_13085 [Gammaproteobacteria bacterium]
MAACKNNDGHPGFVAMQAVERITQATVRQFAQDVLEAVWKLPV